MSSTPTVEAPRAPARGHRRRLIDFHSGHHPFLSQPEAFADSIAAEIESGVSALGRRSRLRP